MNRLLNLHASHARRTGQRGSILIETLMAMVVLTIGLGGLLALLTTAMATNNRSGEDTTSLMISEHVMEQISAQPADSITPLPPLQDCAGTAWSISTADAWKGGGNSNAYGGNGSNLLSDGTVDWTQTYADVPAGYKMQYASCGAGGRQTTFDVRWDVIKMSSYSRMIVVSARPDGSTMGGVRYVTPVSLRTIGGM
jgi:Tfp pilus assembly protein PilV